jgi:hypothetical protein
MRCRKFIASLLNWRSINLNKNAATGIIHGVIQALTGKSRNELSHAQLIQMQALDRTLAVELPPDLVGTWRVNNL